MEIYIGYKDYLKDTWKLSCNYFSTLLEYDAQLAPGRSPESDMASSSYLEPNHNHSAASGCGVKSRSGMPSNTGVGTGGSAGGLERPPGSMDRVLKIFHYFETNSEPCNWASNIRHGDGTDVRVRQRSILYAILSWLVFFTILLPCVVTGCYPEDSRDPQIALRVFSGPPPHPSPLWCTPLVTPRFRCFSYQGEIWKTTSPRRVEVGF